MTNKTLDQLFTKQAKHTPDKIAVISDGDSLTYKELHKQSNQVAHYLRKKGIQNNDLIGVVASRNLRTIVNLFGILKVGAAYVPIDPEYPAKRKRYILKHGKTKFLLNEDFFSDKNINRYSIKDIKSKTKPEDLAYVIYTSGSTGNPKGVIISHQSVVNTIIDINRRFKVTDRDRILAVSSMCFDLSVYDIFGSLISGACLVLVSDITEPKLLIDFIKKHKITLWNSVPAILNIVIDNLDKNNLFSCLRLVLLSGDWISPNLPKKIKNHFPNAQIISLGGATEASIWSIYYPIKKIKKNWKSILYGRPLANQRIYILNYNLDLCPINIRGEIYIGGIGVAQGYLNDVRKTKEAFINHPELGRIYKTGDEGRLLSNGNVEFLGRIDNQVKIMGMRVELEEIEANLLKHKNVKTCVVIARQDKSNEKYLVAYYVPTALIIASELKDYLKKSLPSYMIPGYFVHLNKLPLTSNGKIDRSALPKPDDINIERMVEYIEPKTKIEIMVTNIWKDILNTKKVGIKDNFFELGGHSLGAMQVATIISKKLNIDFSTKDIFEHETLEKIVESIEKYHKMEKIDDLVKGGFSFTAVQDWIIENNHAKKTINDKLVITENKTLDLSALRGTIKKLLKLYQNLEFVLMVGKNDVWYEKIIQSETVLNNTDIINLTKHNRENQDKIIKKNSERINTNNKEKVFKIVIIFLGEVYKIIFIRNSSRISNKLFTEILKNFQYLYNLKLLGKDRYNSAKSLLSDAQSIYTPICSYHDYYSCWYTSILEKIRWENNGTFYKSLLPSLYFACLPSYFIVNNNIKRESEFNSKFLGYKDPLGLLNVNYQFLKFKDEKKALDYYNRNSKNNKILLLVGTPYYLSFHRHYKSKEFITAGLERRNVFMIHIALFTDLLKQSPIISSINFDYFGRISKSNFVKFWRGLSDIKALRKNPLYKNYPSFQVLDIRNSGKIKSHTLNMLYRSLFLNVKEFYNDKTIEGSESKGFRKIYFGKQVIQLFKKDIVDNLNKEKSSISDIVMVDLTKRLERNYLFLRDLLSDICLSDNSFDSNLTQAIQIINKWDYIYNSLLDKVPKKVNYQFKINTLPPLNLYQFKFLSGVHKKKLIHYLDEISDLQDKMFASMQTKLKKI